LRKPGEMAALPESLSFQAGLLRITRLPRPGPCATAVVGILTALAPASYLPCRSSAQVLGEMNMNEGRSADPGPRSPGAVRVLLVEDEPSISEPFAQALRRAGFQTTVAATGGEAVALTQTSHPDVVLLDLALPDIDGRDVCRQIRHDSSVPIIMVTASSAVTDRVVGLELGADDYVVKPFATGEVIARIRAVLRRGQARTGDEVNVQDLRIDAGARQVWRGERELELTRKEFDLLLRLAREPGRVVTREELMSDVWDVNWFGSTKTLDVHIAWLRRKLGDDSADPVYIRTVRGVGFSLVDGTRVTP
jgi:DNA-binding response OmpR family regulator